MSDEDLKLTEEEVADLIGGVSPPWAYDFIVGEAEFAVGNYGSWAGGPMPRSEQVRFARQWLNCLKLGDTETQRALEESGVPLSERFDP